MGIYFQIQNTLLAHISYSLTHGDDDHEVSESQCSSNLYRNSRFSNKFFFLFSLYDNNI